jgi:hypothetical protein
MAVLGFVIIDRIMRKRLDKMLAAACDSAP